MIIQHDNKAHQAACVAAEATRQTAVAAANGSAAIVKAAGNYFLP